MPKRYRPTYGEVVGANVARLRKERGLTQAQLGAAMPHYFSGAWGKQTVSAIEVGTRPIELSEVVMLALILETDVQTLAAPIWEGEPMRDALHIRLGDKVEIANDKGRDEPTVRVSDIRKAVAPPESSKLAQLRERVVGVLDETIGVRTKVGVEIGTKKIPGSNSKKEG